MSKTHIFKCAAYNLGLLLRKVWGLSKPRNGEAGAKAFVFVILAWLVLGALPACGITKPTEACFLGLWSGLVMLAVACYSRLPQHLVLKNSHSLTGC